MTRFVALRFGEREDRSPLNIADAFTAFDYSYITLVRRNQVLWGGISYGLNDAAFKIVCFEADDELFLSYSGNYKIRLRVLV